MWPPRALCRPQGHIEASRRGLLWAEPLVALLLVNMSRAALLVSATPPLGESNCWFVEAEVRAWAPERQHMPKRATSSPREFSLPSGFPWMVSEVIAARPPGACCYLPGKKTPGGAGTHTGHTGHTGARGQTDHTDEPHNRPPKPKDTNPHENRTYPVGSFVFCECNSHKVS